MPPVHLSYDASECEELLEEHCPPGCILGYDTEWRPVGMGGDGATALVQLATPSAVLLIPLAHLPARPRALQALLRDPGTCLTGVGVLEDVHKSGSSEQAGACAVDVSAAAHRVHELVPAELVTKKLGLAYLVELMGGPQLRKPQNVTLSNWAQYPLSDVQRQYAAMDAFAGGWLAGRLYLAAKSRPVLPDVNVSSFTAWLKQEAYVHRNAVDAAAARDAAACKALLEAVRRVGAKGFGSTQELVASTICFHTVNMRQERETGNYLKNRVNKLIKKGLIKRSGADGERLTL